MQPPPGDERSRRHHALAWLALVGAAAGGGWVADEVGVPSGYLFVSLLAGLTVALRFPGSLALPEPGFRVGQAVTGVAIGSFLQSSTLTDLGWRWLPVLAVGGATLALTIGVGLVLARVTALDRPTASLGMVAGGATGIVAMAHDLDADERLVAFMQYFRVLVVSLLTPLVVPLVFGVGETAGAATDDGPTLGTLAGWALTIGASAGGAFAGARLRVPSAMLLGPLVVASALTLSGLTDGTDVPPLAREVAFGLIGLGIGLKFERDTVRRIARLFAPVAGAIAALLAACFALGLLLIPLAGVSTLDAYLATTPGGLYAVLPIAYGAGADTTFVLAVQSLRLLAMIVVAPAVVRWLVSRE